MLGRGVLGLLDGSQHDQGIVRILFGGFKREVHRGMGLAGGAQDEEHVLGADFHFGQQDLAKALDLLDGLAHAQAVVADHIGEGGQGRSHQRMEAGHGAHAHDHLLGRHARVAVGVHMDEAAGLDGVGIERGDLAQHRLLVAHHLRHAGQLTRKGQGQIGRNRGGNDGGHGHSKQKEHGRDLRLHGFHFR